MEFIEVVVEAYVMENEAQFPHIMVNFCLVLLQVPKCFVPVQIFWAIPKICLHLVPLQKLLCRHKNQFYWMQIIFLSGTKYLWQAQYINKFLVRYKKFGPAQNILGPVKGQGKRMNLFLYTLSKFSEDPQKLGTTLENKVPQKLP